MPRIATRFYGPALIATGPTTVYTVAALQKIIIRHIHLSNPSGSAVTFNLSIGAAAAGTRLFETFSIGAGQVYDHFCMYTMDVAEILTLAAGTNNVLNITINGELSVLG